MIFSRQLISPKLLYLGNPEDLRDGVGDVFARKVMQIPNLETVFESEQIKNVIVNKVQNSSKLNWQAWLQLADFLAKCGLCRPKSDKMILISVLT